MKAKGCLGIYASVGKSVVSVSKCLLPVNPTTGPHKYVTAEVQTRSVTCSVFKRSTVTELGLLRVCYDFIKEVHSSSIT